MSFLFFITWSRMIGRQTDVKINCVTCKRLTAESSAGNQSGQWETDRSACMASRPSPSPHPRVFRFMKCYRSADQISVEQSALLGLLSWWNSLLQLKREPTFLGKQSVARGDEASWCTNRGVVHFSPKPQFHPWGRFCLSHQAFTALSQVSQRLYAFVSGFLFCFVFFCKFLSVNVSLSPPYVLEGLEASSFLDSSSSSPLPLGHFGRWSACGFSRTSGHLDDLIGCNTS